MSEDEIAIRQLVETWMEAGKNSDIDTLMDLMTDDVLFLVPGREPFGKAAFRAATEAMRGVSFEGCAEICELNIFEDWAWLRNHIEIEMHNIGSNPVHRDGFTLTLLCKEADGRWRLSRDANLVS